jgi:release factor glutamine methyltransferase
VRGIAQAARARLIAAGIDADEAAMDAVLLARHALGWELARFLAHGTEPPPEGFPAAFESLVARRERREPISTITGCREFRGLEFEVTRDVLAPRPETELIVEEAIARLTGASMPDGPEAAARRLRTPGLLAAAERPPVIVDVGTGSGCLAACLARDLPEARVIATDVSEAALAVAARNARRHGVSARVEFRHVSLLEGVTGPVTLIVSNPPYIPAADIEALAPEVRDWEPRQALDGGPDGLDVVRALLAAAPRVLAPGGWLIMEFGCGQEEGVQGLMRESPLELVAIRKDLQQIPRTLVARMPRSPLDLARDNPELVEGSQDS